MIIKRIYAIASPFLLMIFFISCNYKDIETAKLPNVIVDHSKIIEAIATDSIIVLGEQLHNEANSLKLKTEIVKSLVNDYHFDVILFESSFYDMWMANSETPNEKNIRAGLWPFWSNCKEAEGLIHFLAEKKAEQKISIAGIDCQLVNIPNSNSYEMFRKYLTLNNIDTSKVIFLNNQLKNLKFFFYKFRQLTNEEKDTLFAQLNYTIEQKHYQDLQSLFYHRFLQNLLVNLKVYSMAENTVDRYNIRDSVMAENFSWLKKNCFPSKKIIVWASNFHAISQNNLSLNDTTLKQYISFTHRIKDIFPGKVYSLCLSAFKGHFGEIINKFDYQTTYFKSSNKSIEFAWTISHTEPGFINLKDTQNDHKFPKLFYSSCNQGNSIYAPWYLMIDGLLIYKEAEAIHYRY